MLQKISTPLESCNIKFSSAGAIKEGQFTGYGAVFGGIDAYNDTIAKGAFLESISSRNPLMLSGHSQNNVIGKWLSLAEDDTGLVVRGEFTPGHTVASDVRASMLHGAIDGLSIGFRIPKGGAKIDPDTDNRLISKIDLIEISVVSMPADADARITGVKSEIETISSIRDAELFLRDSGNFSRSMATAFVSHIKHIAQRDSVNVDEIAELKTQLIRDNATGNLIDFINKL